MNKFIQQSSIHQSIKDNLHGQELYKAAQHTLACPNHWKLHDEQDLVVGITFTTLFEVTQFALSHGCDGRYKQKHIPACYNYRKGFTWKDVSCLTVVLNQTMTISNQTMAVVSIVLTVVPNQKMVISNY